ncbi:hypothetical protein BCR34DRAFT_654185 [Clohesyomyces aquaticus]|uniref:Uncharacterized protein n=1 Tax=Clohesyomyces aquaticus TaxID=1231657 RepID=A0A1Y1ZKG2_9PLEO|nr:hypothetical protein BCR34DRAFT_654185 [Clohesyomyces aquaticus]
MLGGWDLEATDRVGLEVLVPNLLRLLEIQGVKFDFPARKALMALNEVKWTKLGPALTSPTPTTLIHTLEAFFGTLDFDKVKHHKIPNGSMLASPSSTVAYLMNSSTWDEEAEAYLRAVLDTPLESGFEKDDLLREDIRKLTILLETNLKTQGGIVGFGETTRPVPER